MLQRQAHAWTIGDFSDAAPDWHQDGVLTAPGNRVPFAALAPTIAAFHRDYGDLVVTITSAFVSADGRRIALEWLWEVSRRKDGARSLTEDAILIDLETAALDAGRRNDRPAQGGRRVRHAKGRRVDRVDVEAPRGDHTVVLRGG